MWRPEARSRAFDAMRPTRACREKRRGRGLERDDLRGHTGLLQGSRNAHQHARRPHRADKRVHAADLVNELAADASVAVERIGIVELIGPKGVGISCQFGDSGFETVEERRRHFPSIARHNLEVGTKGPHRVEFLYRECVR